MLWMWAAVAMADPGPDVEIVKPEDREGTVVLSLPGRDGDVVKCDGWALGALPIETKLVEGVHTFEVAGKEPFSVTTKLEFEGDTALTLDLSKAVPFDVDAPTGIRVISNSSSSRRLDGSVHVPGVTPTTPETPEEDTSNKP